MSTDSEINDFIDKLHFRTYNHIQAKALEHFPDVTKERLKQILDKRLKDKYIKLSKIEPYYVHIFSTQPNCWFHDLLDNGLQQNPRQAKLDSAPWPRYWHIFIGTNNHYAVALPLKNKSAASIKQTLTTFINKYHPHKLTSDEEPGFVEKNNLKLLTDNNVRVHIITEQNHSALGIIDRFIRTLRDMNIPTEKGDKQSHDQKYTTFTPKRMQKLLKIYNSTYHSRIKCKPEDMFNDPDMEKEYIFKQLAKKEKQDTVKDFHLQEGAFVRYILPRANGLRSKKRYQISRECYKIEAVNGNIYTLIARDGTVKNLPRYRIMLCRKDGEKPSNCKWADTIPGAWNGVVKQILSYNEQTHRYKVLFSVPGQPDYEDEVPETYLRGNFPQQLSEMERAFIQQKKP